MCLRNINNVDETIDQVNEQTENLKQIMEAFSAPIGAAADFDEVQVISIFLHLMLIGIHDIKN